VDLNKKPVTDLVVKIGTVSPKKRELSILKNINPVESVTLADFKKEHFVQEMVFRKSLEKFNSAICPAIIYVDVLNWEQMKQYTPLIPFFKTDLQKVTFSIIAMETFENVNTLFHINSTPYRNITHYLLLRLGALGYAHGDPSLSNILIDQKMKRPYLIDFGNVQVLTEKETSFMKDELVKPTNYPEVLKILLKGYPLTHPNFSNWDWVKHTTEFPKVEKTDLLKIVDRNWSQLL
jgi:serine/threonine protein kinase